MSATTKPKKAMGHTTAHNNKISRTGEGEKKEDITYCLEGLAFRQAHSNILSITLAFFLAPKEQSLAVLRH